MRIVGLLVFMIGCWGLADGFHSFWIGLGFFNAGLGFSMLVDK
jgi:hypothetical protein